MCGLLLIDKPTGITSFGVVAKIRSLTGEKHVGHTGTLDPMASGVLPVLIGRATKLSDLLLCSDKCYEAKIRLGTVTDTLDITGNVLENRPVSVTNAQIDNALRNFEGVINQVPPMFSAIKKDGVRLYSIARKGGQSDIPSRKVSVYSLVRQSGIDERFEFCVSCSVSKGTYIRSLARDIGEYLGAGAVLTELKRTKTSGFCLSECVPFQSINKENISGFILPASRAVSSLRTASLTEGQAFRFSNGGALNFDRLETGDFVEKELVSLFFKDEFLGVGYADNTAQQIKLKCLINPVGKGQ